MSWSWSHTAEAYADAEANLRDLPLITLQEIWSEWCAFLPDAEDADYEGFSLEAHTAYHLTPADLPADVLADAIWDRASDLQTCDNGGWNAWVCPFGCHTVSFSRVQVSA